MYLKIVVGSRKQEMGGAKQKVLPRRQDERRKDNLFCKVQIWYVENKWEIDSERQNKRSGRQKVGYGTWKDENEKYYPKSRIMNQWIV